MPKKRPNSLTLHQSILYIAKSNSPATVGELVKFIQLKHPLPEDEIIEHILDLQSQGKLALHERRSSTSSTMKGYLLSAQARWYWTIAALTLTTAALVFTIPENAYPLVYARYLLGSTFVLWLPGYSFIRALFPTKVPIPTGTKELDNVERVALSLVTSLALVSITGLLLNYTPWGITLTPITLSLLTLTMTFATVAILRDLKSRVLAQ